MNVVSAVKSELLLENDDRKQLVNQSQMDETVATESQLKLEADLESIGIS